MYHRPEYKNPNFKHLEGNTGGNLRNLVLGNDITSKGQVVRGYKFNYIKITCHK